MTNYSFLIEDNIYKRKTFVFIGDDVKICEKAYKAAFDTEIFPLEDFNEAFFERDSRVNRGITYNGYGVVTILLRSDHLPTIVHELFHAVEYHMAAIGIKHTNSSSEAWAYYLDFLLYSVMAETIKAKGENKEEIVPFLYG